MQWWQTLLMTGGTCLITLLITFIFNWITNRPAVKRKEKEKQEAKQKEILDELKSELQESVDNLREEVVEERKGCKSDHCSLVALVKDIQNTNKSQNIGLQAVLKDMLKIRYLEWIKMGYAPLDARDDLERMYQAYHQLGANGVMDNMRKQFLALPIKSITTVKQKKTTNTSKRKSKAKLNEDNEEE